MNTSTILTTSTRFWGLPPSTGPTEDDWKRALSDITSLEFSARLNVVSGFRSFFQAAGREPSVLALYRAMVTSDAARDEVFERIRDLSRLEVDRRYENPNDTALAVLLWLSMLAAPNYAQVAADVVDRAPQCWYAKKLAHRILAPRPVASGNVWAGGPIHGLATAPVLSGEVILTMNLAIQPEWHWRHRSADVHAYTVGDGLVKVVG